MIDNFFRGVTEVLEFKVPSEWIKATLVLALFSTIVVILLFAYLNYHTKKTYFRLWTVAWLFYAVNLAASIGLEEAPDTPFLVMVRRACIGISALCMFWGSFQLTNRNRDRRELGMGVAMILVWSFVAAYKVRDDLWITIPVFLLLALASAYTGYSYLQHRKHYTGANVLCLGFFFWAMHLMLVPFQLFMSPGFVAGGYVASAVLSLFIAMGMLMLMLEQARERNETLLGEFKKGITQRRLLEQEINISEQRYRTLFESASDAIFLVDLDTLEIAEANHSAGLLVNREPSDLVGRSYAMICPSIKQPGSSALETMKKITSVIRGNSEFHLSRPDGVRVLCEGSANIVQTHRRTLAQISVREITERKKMEQKLRQGEKLSALGQLVAGVAHELNNPLAVVMGYTQMLARQKDLEARLRKDLFKILQESERAAKIVTNLLSFARPHEPYMTPTDINRVVTEVVEARETQLLGAEIQLVMRLSHSLPKTMADTTQIEQVIANLVSNAVQAMANHKQPRLLEVATTEKDRTINITVSDSGPGIPADVLDKIFDPFFTTKAPGKGTGLGLSICYSIVEEHKGQIWVESEERMGTRFHVQLPVVPCADTNDPQLPPLPQPQKPPRYGKHRLLIVDDEPSIAELLSEALKSDSYTIETAHNGTIALERLSSGSYDLIISDLCMPEMGGEQLYQTIRQYHPHLAKRIIFITGDTVSPDSRIFLDQTGNRWLSKPFNLCTVEEIVGDVLRDAPVGACASN